MKLRKWRLPTKLKLKTRRFIVQSNNESKHQITISFKQCRGYDSIVPQCCPTQREQSEHTTEIVIFRNVIKIMRTFEVVVTLYLENSNNYLLKSQ